MTTKKEVQADVNQADKEANRREMAPDVKPATDDRNKREHK